MRVFAGASGYTPANFVDYTCGNTDVTVQLCPGTTTHLPRTKRSYPPDFAMPRGINGTMH